MHADNLVQGGTCSGAAVCGLQGGTWGSNALTPSDAEIVAIAGGMAAGMPSGIHVQGVKYMFLRSDGEMMMGKKGAGGVTIAKSGQALVIGVYGEGVQPNANSNAVVKMADYLKESGY